jgi:hypothetical protein
MDVVVVVFVVEGFGRKYLTLMESGTEKRWDGAGGMRDESMHHVQDGKTHQKAEHLQEPSCSAP